MLGPRLRLFGLDMAVALFYPIEVAPVQLGEDILAITTIEAFDQQPLVAIAQGEVVLVAHRAVAAPVIALGMGIAKNGGDALGRVHCRRASSSKTSGCWRRIALRICS